MRTIPIGTNAPKTDKLYYYAIADKVLIKGRIRYMLFFDADEPFRKSPWEYTQIFHTPNGFHAIFRTYANFANTKKTWFREWKEYYPDSDYQLNNISWLAPHSREELQFILGICAPSIPLSCKYYRDKAVFDTISEEIGRTRVSGL